MKKERSPISKKFTHDDREHLRSYFDLADSFADLIGAHCEIVVHSLENLEKSVVKIVNGHHTGRTLHSPITDLGLRMLRLYEKTNEKVSRSYFTKSSTGALLKSTTCMISGQEGNIIGLFCININLSLPFPDIIKTLMPDFAQINLINNENFSTHVNDVIEQSLIQAEKEVDNAPTTNLKNRNKAIIHILLDNGIFELKEAILIVADYLDITRHAVYKNIREFKSLHPQKQES